MCCDWANGEITRVGPDGAETVVSLDVANRVSSVVRRDSLGAVLLQADYIYYANGLVQSVAYLNGASIRHQYDGLNRVQQIIHRNSAMESISTLQYTYNKRDLPIWVTDLGVGRTYYDYDNRGRLINEVRIAINPYTVVYDLVYEYDAGGNRTRKVDLENNRETLYTYDVNVIENPNPYDSENNRLMKYEVIEPIGGDPVADLLSTTYYYYNNCGNVTHVVTNQAGTADYTGTRLVYASNGNAVTYVTDEGWDGTDPENTYNITYAREFRYDGSRARYLVRELNPAGVLLNPPQLNPMANGDTWSDYDGNTIYGDFTADAQNMTITETRSYQPGIGRVNDPLVTADAEYYHTDLLGSTRMLSNASGYSAPGSESTYTAFGERIPGSANHRFGYAGAYGYQTATSSEPTDPYLSFPFQHVGARYYDPAIGRFLQRDPIGIDGGFNVYEYVDSSPTSAIDPDGLVPIFNPPGFNERPLPKPPRLPTPRDVQKASQWLAGGCAIAIGFGGWPVTAAAVGGGLLLFDILDLRVPSSVLLGAFCFRDFHGQL